MKIWQLKAKIRKVSDRMGFPLVTRKRFNTMRDNYEEEIKVYEMMINGLRNTPCLKIPPKD